MTREEAIRTIEYGEWLDFLSDDICDRVENPLHEALHMAVAAIREQGERRWIPVAERLPEIGQKCLIANRGIVVRGWLRPDGVWKTGVSSDELWSKFSLHPPTHWMPLPEPPREGTP